MIRSFAGKAARDVYDGMPSKAARKVPSELHGKARRLLDWIDSAGRLDDLKVPPGNRLEALKGDLKGFCSVRINDQWRIVFRWRDGDAHDVQIIDYH